MTSLIDDTAAGPVMGNARVCISGAARDRAGRGPASDLFSLGLTLLAVARGQECRAPPRRNTPRPMGRSDAAGTPRIYDPLLDLLRDLLSVDAALRPDHDEVRARLFRLVRAHADAPPTDLSASIVARWAQQAVPPVRMRRCRTRARKSPFPGPSTAQAPSTWRPRLPGTSIHGDADRPASPETERRHPASAVAPCEWPNSSATVPSVATWAQSTTPSFPCSAPATVVEFGSTACSSPRPRWRVGSTSTWRRPSSAPSPQRITGKSLPRVLEELSARRDGGNHARGRPHARVAPGTSQALPTRSHAGLPTNATGWAEYSTRTISSSARVTGGWTVRARGSVPRARLR